MLFVSPTQCYLLFITSHGNKCVWSCLSIVYDPQYLYSKIFCSLFIYLFFCTISSHQSFGMFPSQSFPLFPPWVFFRWIADSWIFFSKSFAFFLILTGLFSVAYLLGRFLWPLTWMLCLSSRPCFRVICLMFKSHKFRAVISLLTAGTPRFSFDNHKHFSTWEKEKRHFVVLRGRVVHALSSCS